MTIPLPYVIRSQSNFNAHYCSTIELCQADWLNFTGVVEPEWFGYTGGRLILDD